MLSDFYQGGLLYLDIQVRYLAPRWHDNKV